MNKWNLKHRMRKVAFLTDSSTGLSYAIQYYSLICQYKCCIVKHTWGGLLTYKRVLLYITL